MGLSIISSQLHSSSVPHGSGSYATGNFTPNDNSILIACVVQMVNNAAGPITNFSISGGGLEWSSVGYSGNDSAWGIRNTTYYADVGTSPGSMQITLDCDQDIYHWQVVVINISGHNASAPIAGFIGSGTNASTGDGAESQSLTESPTAQDLVILQLCTDAASATVVPTYNSGWIQLHEGMSATSGLGINVAYSQNTISPTVSLTDVYTGGGTYSKSCLHSFIVKTNPFVSGRNMYLVQGFQ